MKYELFLYKTTAFSNDAICIDIVNRAISKNSTVYWEGNYADKTMTSFDAEQVKNKMLDLLTVDGNCLCKIEVRHSPQNHIEYIRILTSYEKAKQVLNVANSIAVEYELLLYDTEMDRSFYYGDLYCKKYVTMRLRAQSINNLILQTQKPIWRIRRLENTNVGDIKRSAYVVTLLKSSDPLESRVASFYEMLKSNLTEDEQLYVGNKCFTVCGYGYEIIYCLEAYKKCADRIGYIDGEIPCVELMRRTPCEVAVMQCEDLDKRGNEDVYHRMRFREWKMKYPNPAERFVESLKLARRLKKDGLDISVSSIGTYSGVILHIAEDKYVADAHEISSLELGEEEASLILVIVEQFYPYVYERYYEHSHLPYEMMGNILDKIKAIRELILNNTYSEELLPIVQNMDFSPFIRKNDITGYYNSEEEELYHRDKITFLHKKRHEIAQFYDFVISWVETQLDHYCVGNGAMFNIQGP